MTVRVPPWYPPESVLAKHYIAEPFQTEMCAAYRDRVAHLLGAQLPVVHCQSFGTGEGSSGTYRFLHHSSYNAKALIFRIVPFGRASSSSEGTVEVTSADDPDTQYVGQIAADITSLEDLNEELTFRKTISPDTFAEHTIVVTNVRLHSVYVYEVPRSFLFDGGTDFLLDRSFDDPTKKFTDDGGSDGRGFSMLLNGIVDARTTLRRHWSWGAINGPTIVGSLGNWVTIWNNLSPRGRDLRSAVDDNEMRTRFFPYVGLIGGGTTWDIRIRDAGTVDTATHAGVTTTGWKSAATALGDGASFQMRSDANDAGCVIEGMLMAGAGNLRLDHVSIIESAT